MEIGPFQLARIVLCSGDAGPNSQSNHAAAAGRFFSKAKWIGALRNASERLPCRLVILTTGHGMVNPFDVISPYDRHIDKYPRYVLRKWNYTVPAMLGNNCYDILIFYPGGVQRDLYLEILLPLLRRCRISCITFGKPNMFDVEQVDSVVRMLNAGTTIENLRGNLKLPDRLQYFSI